MHILVFFNRYGGCFTSKGPSEALIEGPREAPSEGPSKDPSKGASEGPLPHTYTDMHILVFFSNRYGGCFTSKVPSKLPSEGPIKGPSKAPSEGPGATIYLWQHMPPKALALVLGWDTLIVCKIGSEYTCQYDREHW